MAPDDAVLAGGNPQVGQPVLPPLDGKLPGFPRADSVKRKTSYMGKRKRHRWKDHDGKIIEWDYRHGRVEVYSSDGKTHIGEFDPFTGKQTKKGDPDRTVEP